MGLYSRCIFPWVLDRAMARRAIARLRPDVVGRARGRVLEVGFGTGHNLPHYPRDIDSLHILEPGAALLRRAERRIAAAAFPVERVGLRDGRYEAPDRSFDTIVTTWTLCSIDELDQALHEMHRVLRPGGRVLFIEHGLSPDSRIAKWQRRLTPINRWIGQGCRLDRHFPTCFQRSPLHLAECEEFDAPGIPRLGGHMFRGAAVRS